MPLIFIGLIASAYAGLSMYEEQNAPIENDNQINNGSINQKYSASYNPEDEATCQEIVNPTADQMLSAIDKDKNNYLSPEELMTHWGVDAEDIHFERGMTYEEFKDAYNTFFKIDTNNNNILSEKELESYYNNDFNGDWDFVAFMMAW
ncbi:MAG: hypothetical protein LBM26_01510 [Methanobrevibacter sp.]|nr:hypothetical protein [Methanobrevibacter sp.]